MRRYFIEAVPKGKEYDYSNPAVQGVQFCSKLFEYENISKNKKYSAEQIEKETPKSERHRLINPYYFCGTSYGEENTAFWDEVYEYINNHYDLDKVKKIYMNADGGAWIKSGMRRIAGITYVLDEFHIEKYLTIAPKFFIKNYLNININ